LNVLANLQRKFLWGGSGSDDNKKIPCVGWNTVCHAKKDGDLGVRKTVVILGFIHCPSIIYFRDCSLSAKKDAVVEDMGHWSNNRWTWV
jgi:hypothetical protein